MVGPATGHLHDPRRIRLLRDVGSLREPQLPLRSLPLALLCARAVRGSRACMVRSASRVVARLASLLPRAPDPPLPGPLSLHLLLLSRRLLQGVLGRPAELRGR